MEGLFILALRAVTFAPFFHSIRLRFEIRIHSRAFSIFTFTLQHVSCRRSVTYSADIFFSCATFTVATYKRSFSINNCRRCVKPVLRWGLLVGKKRHPRRFILIPTRRSSTKNTLRRLIVSPQAAGRKGSQWCTLRIGSMTRIGYLYRPVLVSTSTHVYLLDTG